MRLSDIMSNMDLSVYPILALVLFVGVFVLVMGRVFRTDRSHHAQWARIPLQENDEAPSQAARAGKEVKQ